MFKHRVLGWIILLISTLILIVGTYGVGFASERKTAETIMEAMGTEPTNLDPFKARRRPELTILPMILEPLFVINPKLEVEPLLVELWKVCDDGTIWTLVLRKEIKFHDGTSFNAEAVKFSLEKHMKGTIAGLLKAIQKVDVVDENTVAIKLHKSYPLLLSSLASFNVSMVSPMAVDKAAGEWGSKVIVGTGPFRFKQWISGDRVILERNKDYGHGPSFATSTSSSSGYRYSTTS